MTDSVVVKNNVVYSTIPEYIYPNDNMVKFLFARFDQWPERHIMVKIKSFNLGDKIRIKQNYKLTDRLRYEKIMDCQTIPISRFNCFEKFRRQF